MRYSQAEKMETIRLVEKSVLPVKRTLEELDVSKSTFITGIAGIMRMVMTGLPINGPILTGSGIKYRIM